MNTEIYQKISQLLDDELNHAEEERLLREIRKQPELITKINRYQAVTHALKTDDFVMANSSFLEKIKGELQDEPNYFLPQRKVKKRPVRLWIKTSAALAASVVFFVIITMQQSNFSIPKLPQEIAKQKQTIENKVQIADNSQNAQHERFKAYLQAHSDDLYTHGSINYQPFGRVAKYGQE